MGKNNRHSTTLNDAALGDLRFTPHPSHLLKIKSQFRQNTKQNRYTSIIILSHFNAIALFTLVLPATRRPNPEFFHLKPDDWFPRRPPPEPPTDGYLSPQYESVAHDRLIELGVLRHGLRVDIAHWLKRRQGGSHG